MLAFTLIVPIAVHGMGFAGMDNVEAIKRIEDHIGVHRIGQYPHIRIAEALRLAISALREPIRKWIPVAERSPDGMDWVLCACKDGEVRMLCYDYIMDDWDIYNRPNSCYAKGFVTHWMPLPEPPEGHSEGTK